MSKSLNDNIRIEAGKHVDDRYLTNGNVPYASIAAVNAALTISRRHIGLTVKLVDGNEYWYRAGIADGDLVLKTDSQEIYTAIDIAEQNAKDYADQLIVGLLDDRGNWDASGNAYPTTGGSGSGGSVNKGDLWTISVGGSLGGAAVTTGDVIRALVDLPGQIYTNWAWTDNSIGYVPENSFNKSSNTSLGISDVYYPTQNAVKTYADGLYGSLASTRELFANKSTDVLLGISDILYPTQKAVKTYVDNKTPVLCFTANKVAVTSWFQSGHGLIVGDVVKLNSSGLLIKISDPNNEVPVGIIYSVNGNDLGLAFYGWVSTLSGIGIGDTLYVQSNGRLGTTKTRLLFMYGFAANSGFIVNKIDFSIGLQDLWISASAMWPKATAGCSELIRTEIATSQVNIQTLDFDSATQEFCQFILSLPRNWNRGTITTKIYWTAASGTGDVVWTIKGGAYSNDDALSVSLGAAQSVTDTLLSPDDVHISSYTSAITLAGSPASADLLAIEISRDAANGADTLNADAKLVGIIITLTTDSGVAA